MLELLRDRDVEFDVVEYLKHPLDRATLGALVDDVPDPPSAMVRNDKRFKELGLDPADYQTKSAVVKLLLEHPELMQRPIVRKGTRAVIARPPETVLDLL